MGSTAGFQWLDGGFLEHILLVQHVVASQNNAVEGFFANRPFFFQ